MRVLLRKAPPRRPLSGWLDEVKEAGMTLTTVARHGSERNDPIRVLTCPHRSKRAAGGGAKHHGET